MTNQEPQPERRRPGRPRNEDRQQPAPARSGRIEVMHNGELLSRKRTGNTDPFAIPRNIIPDGMDYQWNTYTVAGEQAVDSQILMAENGWRPVPADRHAGMFMPVGYTGAILRGGMRLEERPMSLTQEARQEEYDKARGQIHDQNAMLGLGQNPRAPLGRGFEQRNFGGRERNAGDRYSPIRTGIDAAIDAPRPRLEIDPSA